jgi:hypothetical protein
VLALGQVDGAAETAQRYAVVEDGLANWPPVAGGPLDENDTIRLQWCHGAPGMITSLGPTLDEDLALAGGELTWRAGPLAKGAGLCHGTAGNGYAFLVLFERTGDERWLERARRFAAHAIAQVERSRARHGTGRYSLWTGDLGRRSTSPTASTVAERCPCLSAERAAEARGRRPRRARLEQGRPPASSSPDRP